MPVIPIINKPFQWEDIHLPGPLQYINDKIAARLEEPKAQRKLILVIVSIALLLDNMLYMVIVPIIPDFLRRINQWDTHVEGSHKELVTENNWYLNETGNYSALSKTWRIVQGVTIYEGEDAAIGFLFASKALIQLMINPFSGAIIDKIGYDLPMMVGLTIMFFSTVVFAFGRSYGILFFARSLQGVGSAFADTSGLAMIADRFTEEAERTKALGIALAFISFGCLVAPPFGAFLYEFAGKEVPFFILALISFADGIMLMFVMRPIKQQMENQGYERPSGTPIWRLLMDPYIAVCAGALTMSNVALAFMEPTISVWMMNTMKDIQNWQMGMIWLPAFFPHVAGVLLTVKLARKYPKQQWLMAALGLALEGFSCFLIPFSRTYWFLMLPICTICFGMALIDTALLPTLGYLVDVRYVSVYGSIYAIADISYSLAYAIGPIIAGGIVESIGFVALNILIAFSNIFYAPVLASLRHIYDYKPFEEEANIMMQDPPDKRYQTYMMQDAAPQPITQTSKNHLEYRTTQNQGDFRGTNETSLDETTSQTNGVQSHSESQNFQQQPQQPQSDQGNPSNPFRNPRTDSNPFRSGFN